MSKLELMYILGQLSLSGAALWASTLPKWQAPERRLIRWAALASLLAIPLALWLDRQ